MNGIEVLRQTIATTNMVVDAYLADLADDDLLLAPAAGCNPLGWQIGHLIASEHSMLSDVKPGAAAPLPEEFVQNHSQENASSFGSQHALSKAEYMQLRATVAAATASALDEMTDSDLDAPAPERLRQWFPTVGAVMVLIATHWLMHAGQWVPLRRQLGKPVVI
jgi:hypothetical protein